MRKLIFLRFFCILVLLVVLNSTVYTQWQKTNGIKGSSFNQVAGSGNNLLAITNYGTVFQYLNDKWSYRSSYNYFDEITKLQDKWITISSNSISLSDDDGLTWQEILHPDNGAFLVNAKIINDKIYAVFTDTVFFSDDLGNTWNTNVLGDTITSENEIGIFFMDKAFCVDDNIIIAAGFTTLSSNFNVVAYSSDFGQSWQVTNFPDGIQNSFVNDITKAETFYYVSNSEGFFKSPDGINWIAINEGLPSLSNSLITSKLCKYDGGLVAIFQSPFSGLYHYNGTNWNLLYDEKFPSYLSVENNEIIFTAEGDVIKYDLNTNHILTTGIVASTSRPIVSSNENVYSVYKSKLFRTTNRGTNWEVIRDSASASIAIKGDTIYTTSKNGVLRSTNSGSDWTSHSNGIPTAHLPKLSSVGLANENVYAGFNGTRARMHLPPVWEQGGVYVSSNHGDSWSAINSGLPQEGGIPSPVYTITAEGNIIIIYTISGRFSLINNSWVDISSGFPPNTYVSNVVILNNDVIFITTNGLFISHDKGVTKENFDTGLPELTYYLTILFSYNDQLYVFATDNNNIVYKYENNQWNEDTFILPENIRLTSLQSVGDLIYAGTYDNGIWKYDPTPTNFDKETLLIGYELSQNYPNPFNPITKISWKSPIGSWQTLKVYDALGNEVATLFDEYRNAGNYEIDFQASSFSSGIYFYKLIINSFVETKKMILLK